MGVADEDATEDSWVSTPSAAPGRRFDLPRSATKDI